MAAERCASRLCSPPRMRLTSRCLRWCLPPQDPTKVAASRESLQRAAKRSESGRKPGTFVYTSEQNWLPSFMFFSEQDLQLSPAWRSCEEYSTDFSIALLLSDSWSTFSLKKKKSMKINAAEPEISGGNIWKALCNVFEAWTNVVYKVEVSQRVDALWWWFFTLCSYNEESIYPWFIVCTYTTRHLITVRQQAWLRWGF